MSFANHTTKPRLLTVSESVRSQPRITLSGAWLRDWGFNILDQITLLSVEPGIILVHGTWPEWREVAHNQLNESEPVYPKTDPKADLLRTCFMSVSTRETPEIILTGAWLSKWGFAIGDRIQLTWKTEGYFHIQVAVPAAQWFAMKQKKELEQAASNAVAALARHRELHPALYAQDSSTAQISLK